jgi:T-complex protein 11
MSESYQTNILRSVLREDLNIASVQKKLVETVAYAIRDASEGRDIVLTDEQKNLLNGLVARGTRLEDPLFSLLFDRVVLRIQVILCASSVSSSHVSPESSRSDAIVSQQAGIGIAHNEIRALATQLEKIAVHAYNVHGDIIVRIASDLALEFSRSASM